MKIYQKTCVVTIFPGQQLTLISNTFQYLIILVYEDIQNDTNTIEIMDKDNTRIESHMEIINEGVFSLHQSNVLYCLYILGFVFCIVGDVAGQVYRTPVFWHFQTFSQLLSGILSLSKTLSFCCILLSIVNAMLWFDFINQSRRVDDTSSTGR